MIVIDRDGYLILGARSDRKAVLRHLEPHFFADREFDIDDLMSDYEGGDWLDFVNSEAVQERVASAHGDWAQYVKAPLVRLQAKFSHRRLNGMSILAAGNIPIASGLSSSSAVVVASAEGIIRLNELEVSPEQFVELCGEGEWYVGTRGGAGDHAAMKFGRRGHVVQVGFFPFKVTDTVGFPSDHLFVVCNSHHKARKTAGARDIFNHRVACYNIGRELLKQQFPRYAQAVEHLRDFNIRNLGVDSAELLEMLKALPLTMTRDEVLGRIPSKLAERYLSTHGSTLDRYPIRAVVIYGLAECERSRATPDLLRSGGIREFGDWMNISHNGDRVVTWKDGNSWPFSADYSDEAMDRLIAGARVAAGLQPASPGRVQRKRAAATRVEPQPAGNELVRQPGDYSCSIPQIDLMVDTALSVEGVLGAQIAGAGLGGCMMALLRRDAYEDLERAMFRGYYEPSDLESDMFACSPVTGSGALAF
jgi:N-acetylgalactosamine kinase